MAELTMSKEQIVREYNEAKDKADEIHVLADLNVTNCRTICEILVEAGITLPPKRGGWKVKQPAGDAATNGVQLSDEQKKVIIDALECLKQIDEECLAELECEIGCIENELAILERKKEEAQEKIGRYKTKVKIADGLMKTFGEERENDKNGNDEERDN